jgi:hypothetical protein
LPSKGWANHLFKLVGKQDRISGASPILALGLLRERDLCHSINKFKKKKILKN